MRKNMRFCASLELKIPQNIAQLANVIYPILNTTSSIPDIVTELLTQEPSNLTPKHSVDSRYSVSISYMDQ